MTTSTRSFVLLGAAFGLLVAAAMPAAAKGPTAASIEGPGGGSAFFSGPGEGPGTPLGDLVERSGFFPAVWSQTPDPMLSDTPADAELGPRWTVTWEMPSEDGVVHIVQELYPLATPQPLGYVAPGQDLGAAGMTTPGGWYLATAALGAAMTQLGLDLDERAPTQIPAAVPWTLGGVAALAVLILLGRTVARRPAAVVAEA